MSSPVDQVPRTPDRRSSAQALFTAFRSLAGGRLKSPTPPPPPLSLPATSSAIYTSSAVYTSSPSPSPSPSPAVGAPHAGSLKSSHSADSSLQRTDHARPLTGAPPELDDLIAQLDRGRPFSERALAVEKICVLLDEYAVQNILGLWSIASDLLLPEQSDDVADAGYKLLKSCASLPKLTNIERNVFFDAASLREGDRCFDKRLDVVVTLTKRGRDVEACESSILPFLLTSLETCFKASDEVSKVSRKSNGKRSGAKSSLETENLFHMFQYTIDVCRFNAKIFTDDYLDLLLRRIVTICQSTTQESDAENCIKLFDTIITYIHVPPKTLRPCLEVLCAIHKQIPSLQEQAWSTLSNLFKSHVGQAAISSLLHTLLDGPAGMNQDASTRKSKQFSLYRGTIQVLQVLLFEDGRNELPRVPMSLLFPALRASIKEPHQSQEEMVISLINTVLAQDSMRNLLLADSDLSDLLDIISTCAERDDDRLCAKVSGSTNGLNVTTAEDAQATSSTTTAPNNVHCESQSVTPSSCPELFRRDPQDGIHQILAKLDQASNEVDFVSQDAIMNLFLRLANRVSDETAEKTTRYFAEQRYLVPSNGEWLASCRRLATGILADVSRPRSLRILVIQTLRETYDTVAPLCASDTVLQCGALLLGRIQVEEDVKVLHELVDYAVNVADQATTAEFSDIIRILQARLDRPRNSSMAVSSSRTFHSPLAKEDRRFGSLANVIATALVRLFTRSVTHFAQKTRILYECLRAVAGNEAYNRDARLTVIKLLFRLRADARHALIVSSSAEGERIAAELCRTEATAVTPEKAEEGTQPDQARPEDSSSWREQRKTSGSSPRTSLNRHTGRASAVGGRFSRPIPPLWMYPGPRGLPEEPPTDPSQAVFSHIDAAQYPLGEDVLDMEITLWLELIISLLQKPSDWEIYSYVLVHLGPQLSNQALVRSCVVQLRMLRNVLCEQVRNSSFYEPPPHTLLKKADVAVCIFHILTVIISYHEYFEKSEEDDLVKAFLQGIVQWDKTSKWCIHALSVCCFEMPLSVSKSLDSIVQKMSQIITKPTTALHILEFLISIARLPELYKNFREDEFKLVFGVCFRYLQHIRDQRDRAANVTLTTNTHRGLRHSGASRDFAASISSDHSVKKAKSFEDDLIQYLYALAYHVITFWFIALKMEDRPKQMQWITRNLHYTDLSGKQVMEEQGQVIVDLMSMVAYSDRDQTARDENFATPDDGEIWKKTWIIGNGLVTIETATRTGVSLITARRPCGARFLTTRPLITTPARHHVPIAGGPSTETFPADSDIGILPDDIFQSFYAPLDLNYAPVCLPDDDMTRRAIASFDRIATVDCYKVGVIYIGEGQTEEREIFMNDMGSPAYTSFINGLGTLCRLKDAKFNTGGLDTHEDVDGEFTYCWRDRCIELVFHITTMMPTNPDDEMTYPNKKRHIGNDFVNLIFNDSGLPYNFDTFPSDFNYVHIVISPESRVSFVDRRIGDDPEAQNRYYKVQAISRSDFPDISPAAEPKIIQGKYLAGYCRLVAINACVFSSVWSSREGVDSMSNWRTRLREITRLKDRYGAGGVGGAVKATGSRGNADTPTASPPGSQGGSIASAPRDQSISQSQSTSGFQRMSVLTHATDRSSLSSSSHD